MQKEWIFFVLLAFTLLMGALMIARRVHGGEPEPPARMATGDAVQLDRDLSHLRELWAAEVPYATDAQTLCTRYRVTLSELYSGAVVVVFSTGEIVRRQQPHTAGK